jgi:serine/threonine protein kinase
MQDAIDSQLDEFAFPLKGRTIDHYKIVQGLDGGGMGLVYRAEDIRLGRPVAIKFLPEDLVRDPGALSRFEREARAASALEHPSICPVYEFGEHEGMPFIVMPLLEGQTLRELIASANRSHSFVPLSDLLVWAIQIAEGLEAAHQRGFIHRDIKPGNIFITRQGQARILDFGLARLATELTPAGMDTGVTPEGRFDPLLSRIGVAIGTAGYMSPEQIRGDKLDARTDLFSFGLVLYEMATGQRAFRGDAPKIAKEILAKDPPQVHGINPRIPAGLERIISKALRKPSDVRYQSAAEMRADLENLRRRITPAGLRSKWMLLSFSVVLLLCGGAVLLTVRRQLQTTGGPPEFKLRQLTTNSAENHLLNGSISPDGNYIAYTDLKGLHLKRLDSGQVRPVSLQGQTVDDFNNDPSWFADSRSFVVNTIPGPENTSEHTLMNASIWKVSVPGGETRKLRKDAFAWSVSPDGSTIAFAANQGRFGPREVWLMGSNGENARKLYDTDENSAIGPVTWSPDGLRISYVLSSEGAHVAYSRDLIGGPPVVGIHDLSSTFGVLMLPDNRALYSREEPGAPENTCNFWTAKLDPQTLKPREKLQRVTNWTGFCMEPTSSTSDGKRIAFMKWTSHRTIYVADLDAGTIRQSRHFTMDEVGNSPIDWTPDGKFVVFWSVRNGNSILLKQRVDGENEETILSIPGSLTEPVVSPDGKWVIWQSGATPGEEWQQLMRVSIDGGASQGIVRVRSGTQAQCARFPSNTCILAERTDDRKQVTISLLDPLRGRGPQLAKFDVDEAEKLNGRLSTDGCWFAVLTGQGGPIRVMSLRGQPERDIATPGLNARQFIGWTANGDGFYITNLVKGGMDLFFVNFAGRSRKLWHNDGDFAPIAMESPDGRHLAIQGSSLDQNLWVMENP